MARRCAVSEPVIPPWTTTACEQCGQDFLASRTEPASPPFVCEPCEMYNRGYAQAIADVSIERAALAERAAVVAWLRSRHARHPSGLEPYAAGYLSDAIERGEHVEDRDE